MTWNNLSRIIPVQIAHDSEIGLWIQTCKLNLYWDVVQRTWLASPLLSLLQVFSVNWNKLAYWELAPIISCFNISKLIEDNICDSESIAYTGTGKNIYLVPALWLLRKVTNFELSAWKDQFEEWSNFVNKIGIYDGAATLSITAFVILTLSITTFSMMTFSITKNSI